MNKRGAVFIFSYFAIIILTGFLGAFFTRSINNSQLARRHVESIRALWLAEAGIAMVQSSIGIPSAVSGTFESPPATTYAYNVPAPAQLGSSNYYTVVSTGAVTSWGTVSRTVSVTMKLVPPDASQFQYGVETTSSNLSYQDKNIINSEYPGQKAKSNSTKSFLDLFGVPKETLEALAVTQGTHFSSSQFGNTINASGITWIEVPAGVLMQIEHLNGSGIVVIEGDFKITGNGRFDGILYVVGTLTMRGNPEINGTVFVESTVDEDMVDIQGSPGQVVYSSQYISNALLPLTTSKSIVSWREI